MNLKDKIIVGGVCAVSAVCAVGSVLGIIRIRELDRETRAYERAIEIRAEIRDAKAEFLKYGKMDNGAAPGLAALGYLIATALENSDIEGNCLEKAKKGDL